MKKIINKLFAGSLLAGMMLVSSCAGDYLDTAPTDSTRATDAVGTTANAMKALNGIAKIMTTQHSYFGGGFAGENNIMIQYESYPSENYNYNNMHPDGLLSSIKSSIRVPTPFTMLTHGITIIP